MAVNAKHLTSLSLITTRCRQCLLIRSQPSRHFSTTPSEKALQMMHTPKDSIQRMLGDKKSRKVEMKGVSGSHLPDDLGIIQQTFIRPPNSEMPRLFGSTWKTRLKLEWLWARTRFQNFASLVYFLWYMQRTKPANDRMPLHLRLRPAIALKLHKEVYTSLASGSLSTVSKMVCSGLNEKLSTAYKKLVANGRPDQSWKIVRYTSPWRIPFGFAASARIPFTSYTLRFPLVPWPLTSLLPGTQAKVMSDRVVPLPMGNNIYLRQCIVRIRSLQSLDKRDGNPPTVADLTEYLVMQQMKRHEDQPATWKMWGTTKAPTRQEMEKMVSDQKLATLTPGRMTLMDRLRTVDPRGGF